MLLAERVIVLTVIRDHAWTVGGWKLHCCQLSATPRLVCADVYGLYWSTILWP